MTRSVEIPEEAVEACAEKMFWQRWGAGWETASAHERQAWKNQAREALEAAALPYLAPAESRGRDTEIPDDAVWVASRTYNEFIRTRPSHPDAMHAALEAALPYVGSQSEPVMNARDKTSFTAALWEIRGLSDQPHRAHGFDAGCPICKGSPEEIASALAFAGMFDAAPAGDGGLREALEKLADRYSGNDDEPILTVNMLRSELAAHPAAPAVPQPADERPLRAALEKYFSNGGPDTPVGVVRHDGVEYWEAPAEDIRELIEGSAVPQPVDREALAICLHSFDGFAIETGEQWSECNADRKGAFLYQADAVLALLGGSEETPGMKLSRLGIEANARNNGAAVLAGEQEQVER